MAIAFNFPNIKQPVLQSLLNSRQPTSVSPDVFALAASLQLNAHDQTTAQMAIHLLREMSDLFQT